MTVRLRGEGLDIGAPDQSEARALLDLLTVDV